MCKNDRRICSSFGHLKDGCRWAMNSRRPSSYQPEYDRVSLSCARNDMTGIPHTVLLHDTEELDDDLGARSNQDLSLSSLLGVVD